MSDNNDQSNQTEENQNNSKTKSNIHIFKGKTKDSHLSLDNNKSVKHLGTIELDEDDLKRPGVKAMIKEGKEKEKDNYEDRLIKVEKP